MKATFTRPKKRVKKQETKALLVEEPIKEVKVPSVNEEKELFRVRKTDSEGRYVWSFE